jgi:hypothetical protein
MLTPLSSRGPPSGPLSGWGCFAENIVAHPCREASIFFVVVDQVVEKFINEMLLVLMFSLSIPLQHPEKI